MAAAPPCPPCGLAVIPPAAQTTFCSDPAGGQRTATPRGRPDQAAPGVRGLTCRRLLYPRGENVSTAVDTATAPFTEME